MSRPIPRHVIPLEADEIALAARLAAGGHARPGGRDTLVAALQRRLGVEHVVPVASGRRALALALHALDLPGRARVGVPSYCFPALVRVIEAYDHIPVFLPCSPTTLTLDPDALATRVFHLDAVLGIQPFGQATGIPECADVCRGAGVPLIEDASQSTGAERDGRAVGSFGAVSVFSMVDGKNLHAFGGGLLATSDARIAARATARLGPPEGPLASDFRTGLVRALASSPRPFAVGAYPALRLRAALDPSGFDAMFDEPDAPFDPDDPLRTMSDDRCAFAVLNLHHLDDRNQRRRTVARVLRDGLQDQPGLTLQDPGPGTHTYNAFPVRVADGAKFARALLSHGVDIRRDYMVWFDERAFDDEVVYLPSHPAMTTDDAQRVVEVVRAVLT